MKSASRRLFVLVMLVVMVGVADNKWKMKHIGNERRDDIWEEAILQSPIQPTPELDRIEIDAHIHHLTSLEESKTLTLPGMIAADALQLKALLKQVQEKEDDYYCSRKGRAEAVEILTSRIMCSNPGVADQRARTEAERQLPAIKKFRKGHIEIGGMAVHLSLLGRTELPLVCQTEQNSSDATPDIRQGYRLQFTRLGMRADYVIKDAEQPFPETVDQAYSIPNLDPHFADPEIVTAEGDPVCEKDAYFLLGLVRETERVLRARLVAKIPLSLTE